MKRRVLTILLPLAAATLGAGCATFSDNDTAVRVEDEVLSPESLQELSTVLAAANNVPPNDTDAEQARNAANLWIQTEALERYFAAEDIAVPDDVRQGAANDFDELLINIDVGIVSDDGRAVFVDFLTYFEILPTVDGTGTVVQDAVEAVDVYVNPRLGTFNIGAGVVPLG